MTAAREALLRQSAERGGGRHAWATTLTLVATFGSEIWTAQIGDGYVVVWDTEDPGGTAQVLAHEVPQDLDPSVVVPLTATAALELVQLAVTRISDTGIVLVSSDGIAPILLDRYAPPVASGRFLAAIVRELDAGRLGTAELVDFLGSDLVCGRTDDDKSVIIAWRGGRFGTTGGSDSASPAWPWPLPRLPPPPSCSPSASQAR
jgi:hypothetical protein